MATLRNGFLQLKVSLQIQQVIDTGWNVYSYDEGINKARFQLVDENDRPVSLAGLVHLTAAFGAWKTRNGKNVLADHPVFVPATVIDASQGLLEVPIPAPAIPSGQVLGEIAGRFSDGRSFVGGRFIMQATGSMFDMSVRDDIVRWYFRTFDLLHDEIFRRSTAMQQELNTRTTAIDNRLTGVETRTTANESRLARHEQDVNDAGIVMQGEFQALRDSVHERETAAQSHDASSLRIEGTREGVLAGKCLQGRTLANLWSDDRADFRSISQFLALEGNTLSFDAPSNGDFSASLRGDMFKPDTDYTFLVDLETTGASFLTRKNAGNSLFIGSNILNQSRRYVFTQRSANRSGELSLIFIFRASAAARATAKISIFEGDLTGMADQLRHTPPRELASLGGGETLAVESLGENLFRGDINVRTRQWTGNIQMTDLGGGRFRLNNWAASHHGWGFGRFFGKAGEMITLSLNKNDRATHISLYGVWEDSANPTIPGSSWILPVNEGRFSRGFVLPRDGEYYFLTWAGMTSPGSGAEIWDIMINRAGTTEFVPASLKSRPIQYQDTDGTWKTPVLRGIMHDGQLLVADEVTETEYIQRVAELDIEATNWSISPEVGDEGVTGFWTNVGGLTPNSNPFMHIVSNLLPTLNRNNEQFLNWPFLVSISASGNPMINLPSSVATTPAQARAWLLENNAKIIVPLAEPRRSPIREWALPSHEGTTHLFLMEGGRPATVPPRLSFKIASNIAQRLRLLEKRHIGFTERVFSLLKQTLAGNWLAMAEDLFPDVFEDARLLDAEKLEAILGIQEEAKAEAKKASERTFAAEKAKNQILTDEVAKLKANELRQLERLQKLEETIEALAKELGYEQEEIQ